MVYRARPLPPSAAFLQRSPAHSGHGDAPPIAVEVDERLAAHLRARYENEIAAGALRLVEADVLDTPLGDIAAAPYDVAANLPYHITSPVMHYLLRDEPRPERFVVMVQREVAERIAAPPGAMSYLSVFVQYHATVRVAQVIPRIGVRAGAGRPVGAVGRRNEGTRPGA